MPHLPPSPSNVASFNAALAAAGTHLSRPSSPNSIHSSSSAIFERDIEALPLPSLTLNHKPSKLSHPPHGTALDNSVPAVLDDAVEALSAMSNEPFQLDEVEIEAPAASASPAIGRQSSRPPPTTLSRSSSPSSPARDAFGQVSPPILSQLGGSTPATQSSTDSIPTRPKMGTRISTGMVLPGGFPLHGAGELLTPDDEPAIEEVSADCYQANISLFLSLLSHRICRRPRIVVASLTSPITISSSPSQRPSLPSTTLPPVRSRQITFPALSVLKSQCLLHHLQAQNTSPAGRVRKLKLVNGNVKDLVKVWSRGLRV